MGRLSESEAKDCIQGKLDCMNKCDVFDYKGTDECDSCVYCYSQGTFGEQKESLKMAIKALEKQVAKKVAYQGEHEKCPTCGSFHVFGRHCTECGQAIDYE